MLIDLRARKGGKERNINVKKRKKKSVASLMHPSQGLNLQPSYVPCLGIKPTTF